MMIEIYQDTKSEWRWRLKAANGRIIADSGEGYAKHGNAVRAVDALQRARICDAEVVDLAGE